MNMNKTVCIDSIIRGSGEGGNTITKASEGEKSNEIMIQQETIKKSKCSINSKLLPLKLHFFFYFAGIASSIPYLPLYGRQLNISATGIGIVYSVIPFVGLVAKPFFGWLADRFQKEKILIISLIFTTVGFYSLLIFIPAVTDVHPHLIETGCEFNRPVINYSEIICASHFNETLSCVQECVKCDIRNNNVTCEDFSSNKTIDMMASTTVNYAASFNFSNNNEFNCTMDSTFHCKITCPCHQQCCPAPNEYHTIQFWMFFISNVFAGVGRRVLHSLTDSTCYDMLGGKGSNYGKQRLWGSIGRSASPIFTGYLLDVTSRGDKQDYSIVIYVMTAFLFIDIIIITRLDLKKTDVIQKSTAICKDVWSLLSDLKVVVISSAVCLNGMLSGLYFVYFFWFLEQLGSSKFLIGLNVLIRLIAEIPCFFFAGKIIKKIGHFNSMIVAFIAYFIRFLAYVFIYNPWVILPVELTHGFTFGIFYAAMTSFANVSAPSGTEATLQGIQGALFDGLGMAVGNILGGLGFDYYGGRVTFFIASITSLICAIMTFISHRYIIYKEKLERKINGKLSNGQPYPGIPLEESENML